jgi:hypothetical protein
MTSGVARIAYAVYGIAHRVSGHTVQRQALEELAHGALREALVGSPAARATLRGIRERLERGEFSGLHEHDQSALRAALRSLDAVAA